MPPKKAAAAPLDLFSNPRDELPKAPGEGSGVYQPGRGGTNSDRWGKNSGGGFDSERRSGGFDRDSGFRGAGPREGGFRSGGDREGGFRGGDREGGFRSGGDREGGFRGGDREGGFRSGGFDRDGGARGGFDRDGGARGGFDRDGGARGGFDRDGGARGGFDRDSREGGFRGRGGDDADSGRSENAQWRRPVDNARPADSAPYRSNDSAAWRRPADADSEPRGGDRFQSRESSTPSPAPASSSSGAPAPVKYRPPGMRDNAESAPADRDSFAPPSSPGWKDPRSGPDRFARGAGGDRPFGGDREGGFRSGGDRGFGGDREGGFRSGGDRGFGGDREGGFRSGGDRFGGDRGSGDRGFGGDRSFGGDRRSGFGGGFGSSSSTRTQVPLGTRRQYGSRAGEGAESDRNQNAFSELANDGSGSMPNSPAAGRFQQSGGQRLGKSAAAAAREAEEAEAAAAVKAQADEELAKRNEAVDDNVVVFSKDDLVSELQTALADSTEVTEDILASGLAQLTLSPDTKTDLTRALVKSLGAQPPLPLRAVIDIAQSQKPEEATSIVLSLLSAYQAAKDKAAVEDIIARSKMTNEQVFEALCGNLPAAQQDALLTQNNLMFLKPRPADLLATVTKALDDGVAPAEIVKQIDAAVGAVVVPSECLPIATERALAAVFEGAPASYTAATADKLDPFLPLLARLTRGDKQAQIQLVFSVQEKWFAAGKAKGLGKALLMKLAQSGEPKVVSPHALMAWREDITDKRSKAPSKGSLILQTSAWLSEMEKTLEPEADDDEEEDEDLPTNPNAEFF